MSCPSEKSLSAATGSWPKPPRRSGGALDTRALLRYQNITAMQNAGVSWQGIAEALKLSRAQVKRWYEQTRRKLEADLSNDNHVRYGRDGTPAMRAVTRLRQRGHEVVRRGPDAYMIDRLYLSQADLLARAGLTAPEDLYTELPYLSYFTLETAGRYLVDFHNWSITLVWNPSMPANRQRVIANGVEMSGTAVLAEAQKRYHAATGRRIDTRCPSGLAHGFSKRAV